jgi:subtilisin family serine protease
MRSLSISFVLAISAVSLPDAAIAQEATAQANSAGKSNANQYVCALKSSVAAGAVSHEAAMAVGPELGQVLFVYSHAVKGFAVRLPASPGRNGAAALRMHNSNIRSCVPDGITRAVGGFAGRPIRPAGQSTPWGVDRVGGPTDASASVHKAWIIDSGIDLTHPDLNVDAADGASFLTSDSSLNDANGHGTHVAGIIAAKNNTIGVVGVAAGAPVVPVRVLDASGTGPDSGVIAALDYVYQHAAPGDVVNLSIQADAVDSTFDDAVLALGAAGVFVTVAAGNNGADASNYSPSRANGPNVFTVSAFGKRDTWASFSNYGPSVDWGEPGVNVPSTYKNGGYATLSGTSMAAPHLAGILLAIGAAQSGGLVKRDPDGNPDNIGVK